MAIDIWGDSKRAVGSTVTTEYGTHRSYEESAKAKYSGTGGSWKDGAGNYHNSEYEAREADRKAKINGGYF